LKRKKCTKCGEIKPLSDFNKCWKAKDGHQWQCRVCANLYRKSIKGKIVQKKYAQTLKGKKTGLNKKLKNKYGITLAEYDWMFEQQGGVCAICGRINLNGQRLGIDHNHNTGKVRGLLCISCNHKLSIVEDTEFVKKAKDYLKSNS